MARAEREPTETMQDASESAYRVVRDALLTGVAVVVPVVITIYVLTVALDLVDTVLIPVVWVLEWADADQAISERLVDVLAFTVLLAIIFAVGFLTHFRYGERAIDYFDFVIERVPGLGAVYKSFRQMSDVMLQGGAENFREVKLVEFPHRDTYTLGFKTTETPEAITRAAGSEEMETVFLPLAPNPVMGGFLAHIPAERVSDVDMTVEEGLRTVVTTGVATADADAATDRALSASEMERLTGSNVAESIPTNHDEADES